MSETGTAPATTPAGSGRISLANGSGLEYRVFARQVEGVPGYVMMAMASCYYPVSGWRIFFEGSAEDGLTLMQEEPTVYFDLNDFVSASWAPGSILVPERPATVQVTDGAGTHTVAVEDWGA